MKVHVVVCVCVFVSAHSGPRLQDETHTDGTRDLLVNRSGGQDNAISCS